jgi:hypothetical protein
MHMANSNGSGPPRSGDSVTGAAEDVLSPEIASAVRGAVGAHPGEQVIVTTPQFVRPRGDPAPAAPPASREEWKRLADESKQALKERGLRAWSQLVRAGTAQHKERRLQQDGQLWEDVDENGTHLLMLFPGEWYSKIPADLEIVDIFGVRESFVPGQTDDDIRFGCLSFGVVIPLVQETEPRR